VSELSVAADELGELVATLFQSVGVAADQAAEVAAALVNADQEGIASHGVMLVPLYLQRIRAGSVCVTRAPLVVEDHGGLVVMSACHTLGQISAKAAVDLAVERARLSGVAAVAVRDAFHFGAASFWSRRIAGAGMIGFAFSNTRPLMPAPGGAERVVGNNPLSIAFPSATAEPVVVDMAMSATAMGKIRLADAQGQTIPEGWATDAQGESTTSAAEAIKGMLLPAAGPKGFGMAVAIDLLCGALSGGSVGAAVRPLYGELDQPYGCAHAFIAIDAGRVGGGRGIAHAVDTFATTIRQSKPAAGTRRLFAPGDLERARRAAGAGRCVLASEVLEQLNQLARQNNITHELAPLSSTI
jgi:LDH2 family malate/lactate/ureidoglycolate dehydrogenase